MVFAWLVRHQKFYTNRNKCLWIKSCGTGYGNYIAPKRSQLFLWKAMCNRVPIRQYLAFSRLNTNEQCPRCNNMETTIHILRDCPWAKEVWDQSSGILPLSFFHMPLQAWLWSNATANSVILHQQLPWKIYFPFLCWNL